MSAQAHSYGATMPLLLGCGAADCRTGGREAADPLRSSPSPPEDADRPCTGYIPARDGYPSMATELHLPEEQIQEAIFEHLRRRGVSGIVAWHPKNGGVHQQSKWQRMKNARQGVLSGIQDVHILKNGQLYCLELKTRKGKERDEQRDVSLRMVLAGAICGIAYGLDDALAWLESRGLLIGMAA